ncbi:family A G protein-coupled receptor-like protein [Aspergillus heteromorphus CBS 117.55]|uniref:Family A G protein-coupled receptor-like protein n=1 Tax=Aspergillus heteromorphus CBS 117.55 TaxID=1448321 RepID=A0A317VUM6_9EURO|nr:family A G protein-coupled receptor-like protein [Aspergillus heteromorphus CBS 117.55]PWY77041.1 family A G protein-coupled receptor-like protein [Aspergillus heteromorphus CBS 117.55]
MIESFVKQTQPLPWPEPTPTSSVAPIPTVVPGSDPIFQTLHDTGKRTLWVVTVLMGISSLVFYVLGARVPISKRVFHTLISLATTISFIVYLALATGEGMDFKLDTIKEHNKHVPNTSQDYYRQVLWLRYVLWFLTEPLGLISLSLLGGLPGAHLLVAIAADYVMLGSGLLGIYAGHTSRRWVWFTISAIGYLTTVYHISVHGARAASNKDSQTRRFFGTISGVLLFVKILYPVALAAGPLSLKVNVDVETILLAIYDIFSQGIIGYWLLLAHDASPGITLNVDGFWSHGIGNEGAIRISEEDGA